tara:strand:- start:2238 stop:2606 length:369 start_codon:yes stop_codon:yes gene_type:complete
MNKYQPLSPHLSIHRKIFTAVFSILHRFTGIGLSFGSILIVLWIGIVALGPSYFSIYEKISYNLFFKFILFIWTLVIFYHLFNGVRYLYWSFGLGMSLKSVYVSGYIVLFLTIIFTFGAWFF